MPPFKLTYKIGILLVLLAGSFWSTMGIAIRFIDEANVWQILFYRSIALSLFLIIIIFVKINQPFKKVFLDAGISSAFGGLGLVVAFSGGIYAIQITTVANAMFLFATAPFIAALLGWFFLREPVRWGTWIAMIFATLGVITMVWGGFKSGNIIGNIMGLLSALGFAIFTVALRWGKLKDMMPTVFLGGIFASCLSGFIIFISHTSFYIPFNDLMISCLLGVFQVGIGLTLYTIGSKVISAVELTLLSMTEVILGPFWVWLFLSEMASLYTILGGAILIFSIIGNALSGIRKKPIPIIR